MLKINGLKFNNPKLEQKIKKRLEAKASLEVGFIDGSKYPNGASVATVAFWNNYGTIKSPARPFFDNAISENTKKWFQTYKDAMQSTGNSLKALEITGTIIKDDIAQSIITFNEVPDAPYTIAKKGSSNPLVDTGFMASNVTYKVSR